MGVGGGPSEGEGVEEAPRENREKQGKSLEATGSSAISQEDTKDQRG